MLKRKKNSLAAKDKTKEFVSSPVKENRLVILIEVLEISLGIAILLALLYLIAS